MIRTTEAPAVEPVNEAAIAKTEKRVEPVSEAAGPKTERRAEPPPKAIEKPEKPALAAQTVKPKQPEAKARDSAAQKREKKKPAAEKKPFPVKRVLAAVLVAAVIAEIVLLVAHRYKQKVSAYETAIQEMSQGNYAAAEQHFSALSGYRDAEPLSVYCKYAGLYRDETDYVGGAYELQRIEL